MKAVKKIIKFSLFLIVISITLVQFVNAKEEKPKVKMCTLSKEYIAWEQLSDKEKSQTMMPPMCDSTKDEVKISKAMLLQDEEILPKTYDIRGKTFEKSIKNQQDTGSCWAFSTTSALEILMKKKYSEDYIFSPRHMVYSSTRTFLNGKINLIGYNNPPSGGGNYFMSSNYLVNNYGPVLEQDMPFENNENIINIESLEGKTSQIDVNNVVLSYKNTSSSCTNTEINTIKKYVYDYGSVLMSTYIDGNYYQYNNAAYYYNGSALPNHAVAIVGWDDNYSKDNFISTYKPKNDGAWIVQNSYGTTFGKNGYYYVSYEDINVCNFYMVVRETDDKVEDNAYVLDSLGFNGFIGYTQNDIGLQTAYAMNIFNKKAGNVEVLREITFGSDGAGTYEIYYSKGNASTKNISDMTLIGTGVTDARGYFTYKLQEELILDASVTEFSIAIKYNMSTSTVPIALSASNSLFYQYITLDDNKSFISPDGTIWEDLKQVSPYTYIASIKAATDDYKKNYEIDETSKIIFIDSNTSIEKFNKDVDLFSDNLTEIISEKEKMYTGQQIENYTVVVKGDVTGDGISKMNDVMMISKFIVDGTGLEEQYLRLAADVNKDSNIKMNDVMRISQFIVEGGKL